MSAPQPEPPESGDLGTHIRNARNAQGMTLRELARRISVSPSFVSQLERNKVNASVGTLYKLVNALGLSLDEMMTYSAEPRSDAEERSDADGPAGQRPRPGRFDQFPRPPSSDEPPWPQVEHPVQRADARAKIQFPGVVWERLTHDADPFVDFLQLLYSSGSASCPETEMMRHGGREYGYILTGKLDIQVGFDTHTLEPGDSITFDAMTPHRLTNPYDDACSAIWIVVGRREDGRSAALEEASPEATHLPSIHP